jgi:hypothetical protein
MPLSAQLKLKNDLQLNEAKQTRLKAKNDLLNEKLDKQDGEFKILKDLYEEHLGEYEQAMLTKRTLEEEVRLLRNNQD